MTTLTMPIAALQPQRRLLAWLAKTDLLGLAASTALVAAGLAVRMRHAHRGTYLFLLWNLVLAWVPALVAETASFVWAWRGRPAALFLGFLWLAFFPNAPYVITDLVHLHAANDVPLWFDASLLFAAGWTGLLLGIHSLETMQRIVAKEFGSLTSTAFALTALGLASIGVQLGRFERWNSWDVLSQPAAIGWDLMEAFTDPGALRFECFFFALLLCSYWVWMGSHRRAHVHRTAGEI
jgi:uncharacterized membrane protein